MTKKIQLIGMLFFAVALAAAVLIVVGPAKAAADPTYSIVTVKDYINVLRNSDYEDMGNRIYDDGQLHIYTDDMMLLGGANRGLDLYMGANLGWNRIYDNNNLHIWTDDYLYLNAPVRTYVQNELYFLRYPDKWEGTQSRIHDDNQLRIETDDFMYLNAPNTVFVSNNFVVGNDTFLKGDLDIWGDIYNSTGAVVIADSINQTGGGQVTFSGNVDANSGVDVTGLLSVAGAITQTGSGNQVTFAGNVNANNGVDVVGLLSVNGPITQTGTGQVTFSGNVDANNGLDVAGANFTVGGGYGSTGTTIDNSGNISTDGNVTIEGNTYTDNIYPNDDSTYDIGASGNEYDEAYIDDVYATNSVQSSGGYGGGGTTIDTNVKTDGYVHAEGYMDADGSINSDTGYLYDEGATAGAYLRGNGSYYVPSTIQPGDITSDDIDDFAYIQNGNSFGTLATLGTNDGYSLAFETGGTEWMRINTSGNVGIGTTSPANLLTIQQDKGNIGTPGDGQFRIQGSSTPEKYFELRLNTESDYGYIQVGKTPPGSYVEYPLILEPNGGNVGIGTINPASFKLQVAGNVGPDADATYDLGSASPSGKRWRNGYFSGAVNIGATLVLQDSGISDSNSDVIINDNLAVTGTSDMRGAVSNSTGNLTISDTIDIGSNTLQGTTAVIDLSNFDVAANGNITVASTRGLDTNAAGTLNLGNSTATTISVGSGAATTVQVGNPGTTTTMSGATRISSLVSLGTADMQGAISNSTGNLTLSDTVDIGANTLQGTTAVINFTNFDVSAAGNITVAAGQGLDTNAAGALNLGADIATTINIGVGASASATTINIGGGGGGSVVTTIQLGNPGSTTSLAGSYTGAGAGSGLDADKIDGKHYASGKFNNAGPGAPGVYYGGRSWVMCNNATGLGGPLSSVTATVEDAAGAGVAYGVMVFTTTDVAGGTCGGAPAAGNFHAVIFDPSGIVIPPYPLAVIDYIATR